MMTNHDDPYASSSQSTKLTSSQTDSSQTDTNHTDKNKNQPDKPSSTSSAAAAEGKNSKAEASMPEMLSQVFDKVLQPNANTIVCGALDEQKVKALSAAGIEHVINFQPIDELDFDEEAMVKKCGMTYSHLPISGADDLKQINVLAFDRILREQYGKKIAMHCKSGNRVGAVAALRAGWLRARKMETALAHGHKHGLAGLEDEVKIRLLVPR